MLSQRATIDRVFHALGDPTRRAIVEKLSEGPISVSLLAKPLDITLAAVVQHLQLLEKSGLVTRRVLTTGRLGVEYAFTELGRTLEHPVASLFKWTTEYADVVRAAQVAFDATAGGERDAA